MTLHHHGEAESETSATVLSGTTPIHVKFIGWLVITCATGFGGSIWWAATMSAKMDMIIANQAAAISATRVISDDVSRLKEWRVQIDTIGSPTVIRRLDNLEKSIEELGRQWDIHKATTMRAKPSQPITNPTTKKP